MKKRWKLLKFKFSKGFEQLIIPAIYEHDINGIEEIEREGYKIYKVFFDVEEDLSSFKNTLKILNVDLLGEEIVYEEDWGSKWKENFKGIEVTPFFVRPPWVEKKVDLNLH